MQELVPVLFAFAIGVPVVHDTTAHRRIVLSLLTVAASATVATVSSDKFGLNWTHVLLDLGGAAFGVALAFGFVQVLERAKRRVQARELR
jgi:hypothetical protein